MYVCQSHPFFGGVHFLVDLGWRVRENIFFKLGGQQNLKTFHPVWRGTNKYWFLGLYMVGDAKKFSEIFRIS